MFLWESFRRKQSKFIWELQSWLERTCWQTLLLSCHQENNLRLRHSSTTARLAASFSCFEVVKNSFFPTSCCSFRIHLSWLRFGTLPFPPASFSLYVMSLWTEHLQAGPFLCRTQNNNRCGIRNKWRNKLPQTHVPTTLVHSMRTWLWVGSRQFFHEI